jgi:hypothetical protein
VVRERPGSLALIERSGQALPWHACLALADRVGLCCWAFYEWAGRTCVAHFRTWQKRLSGGGGWITPAF